MNTNLQPALLQNDFVTLRPLKEEDFEDLYKVASDPLIWEQHPTPDRYKRDVFEKFFRGGLDSGGAFMVSDRQTGAVIGSSRYYQYEPEARRIAIGYTFLPTSYWGTSYNKALKQLMIDYAFQFADTVLFHVGANNIRSQRAVLKLGAVFSGVTAIDYYGTKVAHNEYEIKKADWVKGA